MIDPLGHPIASTSCKQTGYLHLVRVRLVLQGAETMEVSLDLMEAKDVAAAGLDVTEATRLGGMHSLLIRWASCLVTR
jgi:hypothetical protein